MRLIEFLGFKQQGKKAELWEFLLRMLVLSLPFYAVLSLGSFWPLQVWVAWLSSSLLNLMGFQASANGTFVTVMPERFSFLIDMDCTGWKSLAFFTALILAVPGVETRKRIFGILVGFPLLFAVNLGRIVNVVVVQRIHGVSQALFFHDFVWQLASVFIVLLVWALWLKLAGKKISSPSS